MAMGIDKHENISTIAGMKIDTKIIMVGLLLACTHAMADDKHASFGMLGGQYSYTHTVSSVEGGDQEVTDRLLLAHDGYAGYHAEIDLKFDFGSNCVLAGDAQLVEGSAPARMRLTPDDAHPDCALEILVNEDALVLSDSKNTCRSYCGVAGSFDGAAFARATKVKAE